MRRVLLSWIAFGFGLGCGMEGAPPAVDEHGPALLCGMGFGDWVLGAPSPMTDVIRLLSSEDSDPSSQVDPVFSEDGLSLYFSSDHRVGWDVWKASRPSLDQPFDTLEAMGEDVNSRDPNNQIVEFGFQPLDSLNLATVCANYPAFDRQVSAPEIQIGSRVGDRYTWEVAPVSLLEGVDGDARLSADGLSLYFSFRHPDGTRDIVVSRRDSLTELFDTYMPLMGINTPEDELAPFPTPDGKALLFSRASSRGAEDLYYAEVPSADIPITFQAPLDALNSDGFDGEAVVFDGGNHCEVVFVSDRAGFRQLYRAPVLPR